MASPAFNPSRIVSSHQRKVLRTHARRMRHEATHSEWLLWQVLRQKQLGVRFRRQVVLQGYVADFYASSVKLIVEIDGSWHDGRASADSRRDRVLNRAGYYVLHVSAAEVELSLPAVLAQVSAAIERSR